MRTGLVLRFAVAGLLLLYLVLAVSPADLLGTLARAAPAGVAGAVLLAFVNQLLITERIQVLTGSLGLPLPYWSLFRINVGAVFYGLLLPAGNMSGVAARLYQMSRAGGRYAEPAVALAFERLVATATMCAVGVTFWLIDWPADSWPVFAVMLAAMVAFAVLYLMIFTSIPWLPGQWRSQVASWPKLRTLLEALRRSRALPRSLRVRVWVRGLVTNLVATGAYALVAWSLDLDLGFATVAWTRSAALLVALVPVSVAGLGLREGALVVLLMPYGVSLADAVAYGLLAFASTSLIVSVLGGLLEGWRWLTSPV